MTSPSEGDALAALLDEAIEIADEPFEGLPPHPKSRSGRRLGSVLAEARAIVGVRMPGTPDPLREAAQALVEALDRCKPTLDGYAVMAHVHGQRYDGPTFGVEWEALRTALGAARLPREAAP